MCMGVCMCVFMLFVCLCVFDITRMFSIDSDIVIYKWTKLIGSYLRMTPFGRCGGLHVTLTDIDESATPTGGSIPTGAASAVT